MAKEYKDYMVRGCVEATNYEMRKSKITIETVIENVLDDEADFFGVYKIKLDGADEWIADFKSWDDAQMFALEKEKEEGK
jgi:hypothetical protein